MTDPTIISTAREIKTLLGYDPDTPGHIGVGEADWGRAVTLDLATARRLLVLATKAKDAWACVPEEDAVEMLGALSVASQMYATCGDKVMSGHFQGLYGKYAHRQEF